MRQCGQETHKVLSDKTGGIPNELAIYHNAKENFGYHIKKIEPLYYGDDIDLDKKRWKEHPKWGDKTDFIALLLTECEGVHFYPYDLVFKTEEMQIVPSDSISIVGFPFGKGSTTNSNIAIWVNGFLASEPEIDFEGLPRFLVDCRGRPGLSGSPVIAYRNSGPIRL